MNKKAIYIMLSQILNLSIALLVTFVLCTTAVNAHSVKKNHTKNSAAKKFIQSKDTLKNSPSAISQTLTQNLNTLINKYDGTLDVGVVVQDAETGATLYEQNAHRLMKPASTLKIFTAVAALTQFGKDYTFHTDIISKTKTIQNGTLNGDLYFYFDGDPTLSYENLLELIDQLHKLGINNINGNIHIDDSIFDDSSYGPGWMWDEENFCYAAPTNAVMLNKNCFPFQIKTGAPDQLATVTTDNEHNFMSIVSSAITKRAAYDDCPLDMTVSNDNEYHLTGCIWPRTETISLLVAVKNIRLYTQDIITKMLLANNIQITGKIDFAHSPVTTDENQQSYFVLARHESQPLSNLVKTMLKKSDNLIANALFKKMGFEYFHKTGTWKNGARATCNILAKCAPINFQHLRIVDGAGLSQYNLITPMQMASVLYGAYHNDAIQLSFLNGLPTAGTDGHLQYRFTDNDLRGKIIAKTGTMKNISALAGYLTTSKNQKLIFTIMVNDFVGKIRHYQNLEDDLCTYLVRHGV